MFPIRRTARPLPGLLLLAATGLGPGCSTEPCDDTEVEVQFTNPFEDAADIEVVERLHEFELIGPGREESVQVRIANVGDERLNIDRIEWDDDGADNFSFNTDDVPEFLNEGDEVLLDVVYRAISGPDTRAALHIYSDDPDEERVSVGFIGRSVLDAPQVELSTSALNFDFVPRGGEGRATFEVRNPGTSPLTILELSVEGGGGAFEMSCPDLTLQNCNWADRIFSTLQPVAPDGSQLLELAFSPSSALQATARLIVRTDDPVRPVVKLPLWGNPERPMSCTPPAINLLSPSTPQTYARGVAAKVEASAFVTDTEETADALNVGIYIGELLVEDELANIDGSVSISGDIDRDEEEAQMPDGLHTFHVKVLDGCRNEASAAFVGVINGSLQGPDNDADGYSEANGDCDDTDPDRFPDNIEAQDGKDNDCDGDVDDETRIWDDDGDGVTEADGDCDDDSRDMDDDGQPDGAAIHPGATETLNRIDDDCDGEVDEDTAGRDDDGDGLSEIDGDCDDTDPTVFGGAEGGALEWCDEIDNDCDSTIDDGCLEDAPGPWVVGDVILPEGVAPLSGTLEVEVLVLGGEGELTYEWTADKGTFEGEGAAVTWIAPESNADNDVAFDNTLANLVVGVTDAQGRTSSGFATLLLITPYSVFNSQCGGCSIIEPPAEPGGASLLFVFGLLAAGAVRLRRD